MVISSSAEIKSALFVETKFLFLFMAMDMAMSMTVSMIVDDSRFFIVKFLMLSLNNLIHVKIRIWCGHHEGRSVNEPCFLDSGVVMNMMFMFSIAMIYLVIFIH